MNSITQNIQFFLHEFGIVSFKDGIEIVVFSVVMYYFLLWLHKDQQKNLLAIVYSYYGIGISAHYCSLTTISTLLWYTAPGALLVFIILHQETLQRNFIMLKRITKPVQEPTQWIDELMKLCLNALNNKKELICVIERTDSLRDLLETPGTFYADIKKETIELLLEKQVCNQQKFVWLNQEGKLLAINAHWKVHLHKEWISDDGQALAQWKQDALFITSKTDALLFKINILSRSFDIINNGVLHEHNDAHQTAILLRKSIIEQKSTIYQNKTENTYAFDNNFV